jgi:hypothetical protein
MKRFLGQLALFGGVQLLVALLLWSQIRHEPGQYLEGTNLKHALLADPSGPRLVLLGGSNLAYGIDSELLAERLGYRPVNMGLHAALGIEFMCREALADLRPGDVVVLSPEYPCFGHLPDAVTQFQLIEHRPASARFLRQWNWESSRELLDRWALPYLGAIARRGVRGMKLRLREWRGRGTAEVAFNEYGDFIAHRQRPMQPSARDPLFASYYRNGHLRESIEFLNAFHAECRRRGVQVYYSFCPSPQSSLASQRELVSEIEAALRQSLTIPLLDTPEQLSFGQEAFYDTPYHLNWQGRRQRTEILAANLSRQETIMAAAKRIRR